MANMIAVSTRTLLLTLVCLAAGCGGSHDNTPGDASGLPASSTLVSLTDADKGQLCDWIVAKIGSYGTLGTPGICPMSSTAVSSPFFSYVDQAHCIADSPTAARQPNCDATVETLEACVNALPRCPVAADIAAAQACGGLSDC